MKRLIGVGILVLLIAVIVSSFWLKRRPMIWLAASPYDEATTFDPKSDVAFCFQMKADGRIDVSQSCLKRVWVSAPIKRCGVQNLDDKNWLPAVIKNDPHNIALNLYNLRVLGCREIVLDIEEVTSDYTPWMVHVLTDLHKEWPAVYTSVAVYAKSDSAGGWPPAAAQDWNKLCAASDEILLMAYDYRTPSRSTSNSEASEMAPLDWVDQVVHYGLQECGAEKLRLGLAAYGYNWSTAARVSERDYMADASLRANSKVRVETEADREAKISLARKWGIYNFFLWSKGQQAQK